jgi:hypothetical protein
MAGSVPPRLLLSCVLAACAGDRATLAPANECPAGQEPCGGSCVDTQLRRDHCGACDVACAEGEVCSLGQCGIECLGGTTHCGDFCVDTMIDENNCGDCGVTCSVGGCDMGSCPCEDDALSPGETDVDCGGATCAPCAAGDTCVVTADCEAGLQCLAGACTADLPPLDESLVGLWRLEGNADDASGQGNHLTVVGAVTAPGKVGGGYAIAEGDCLAGPDSASLDMIDGEELTMMAWIQLTAPCAGTRGVILNKESTYEMGVRCPEDPPAFQEAIQVNDAWAWAGTGTVTLDAWHHVAVTWDSTTVRQYVNGVVVSTRLLSGAFDDRTTGFGIGCRGVAADGTTTAAGSFFAGVLDEVAVYSRALSEAEIVAYYRATS